MDTRLLWDDEPYQLVEGSFAVQVSTRFRARVDESPMDTDMHLIQLLLPLYDNDGQPFPRALLRRVREELTERFGGVTAFARSPAVGAWEDDSGDVQRDELILVEVMAEVIDAQWWAEYREDLRQRFRQDALLIRATRIEML